MLPVNEYGNIEVIEPLPPDLIHIDLPQIAKTCKKLGIEYARAVVGFRGDYQYGYRPRFRGVVVAADDEAAIRAALVQRRPRKARSAPDILTALFSLNRRAKRCRDLAQTYYRQRMHGFAGEMRREKEDIYFSKGQALHHLVSEGRLAGGQYHRFEGGNYAEILVGDGYTFHRPCPPPHCSVDASELAEIEAKPKAANEPTLTAARQAVNEYLADKPLVTVYSWPNRPYYRDYEYTDWRDDDWELEEEYLDVA